MDEIMQAVAKLQNGDRDEARNDLDRLWKQLGPSGAPLQRCTIAHFLADTEADLSRELEWDLLALEAATGSSEAQDRNAIDASVASFLPSLHLNVGDAYRRLGESRLALQHAILGLANLGALREDNYAAMVRSGLARLQARLSAGDGS
ncbi:hypothetical protein [Sphingomonas adhaesiva]|uniref:hypothetical protein n=1 Tax=Sphingomonas adhaesiva TaxID=28212 RepID=UPI002FF466B0